MKKRSVDYLNELDFSRLKSVISSKRDNLLLDVLYETGCTVKELVNIKLKNVNFTRGIISIPASSTKSGRRRICYISQELLLQLKGISSTYLFITRQSGQITTKRVRQLIQRYSTKAGLGKINPQMIRYTHMAHALKKGIPLPAVQKQVGMEKLRLIQIYEALTLKNTKNPYGRFW